MTSKLSNHTIVQSLYLLTSDGTFFPLPRKACPQRPHLIGQFILKIKSNFCTKWGTIASYVVTNA